MATRYTDQSIAQLLAEHKVLAENYRSRIQLRNKRGHKERELDLTGVDGNQYRLILRLSDFNPLDFSVVLAFCPADTNQIFRLRRYNGKSHEHSNPIERVAFYDFHIHQATERYQDLGAREDSYAEPTDRYSDYQSALDCLLADCGFEIPRDPQLPLF
jgi:hypothetical protein